MTKFFPLPPKRITTLVQSGDRDASWTDSIDLADALAGTLGPVFTQDTLDLGDAPRAEDLFLGDAVDLADRLRDVLGPQLKDSLDISDQLAGNLGPVFTQDSLDLGDSFVAKDFVLADSIDLADIFGAADAGQLQDTLDFNDQLAGNLGPVFTQDSLDFPDTLDAALVLQDSLDFNDLHRQYDLSADHSDSLDLSDEIDLDMVSNFLDSMNYVDALRAIDAGQVGDSLVLNDLIDVGPFRLADTIDFSDALGSVVQFLGGHVQLADSFGEIDFIDLQDTLSLADNMRQAITGPRLSESIDFSDSPQPTLLVANDPEGFDLADLAVFGPTRLPDSLDLSDVRRASTVSNALHYLNALVGTPVTFTSTGNYIDASLATEAIASVTSTGGLLSGNPVSANPSITGSLGDITVSPGFTSGSVFLDYHWTTTIAGLLQSGHSVNMTPAYSLNDGASWTNLPVVTTVAGTATPTVNLGVLTITQINQFRFRWTGTINSGKATLNTTTQTFQAGGASLNYSANIPAGS